MADSGTLLPKGAGGVATASICLLFTLRDIHIKIFRASRSELSKKRSGKSGADLARETTHLGTETRCLSHVHESTAGACKIRHI